MKKRLGFVSNSSSASYICQICNNEYDVESRGGTPDEWRPPTAGLCESCTEDRFICLCGQVFDKKDGHKVNVAVEIEIIGKGGSYVEYEYDNNWVEIGSKTISMNGAPVMYSSSNYVCPKCFATHKQTKTEFDEWSKKISNPDYVLTDVDKKILEHAHQKVAK